ncbi:hypothetical protein [Ammoniphilus sp. 3BR4]|uniref:hypothetical protein n=1 Tax=Ammoniphilus sp. 3BR4 TaxID=3158265 RepID=UPI003466B02E
MKGKLFLLGWLLLTLMITGCDSVRLNTKGNANLSWVSFIHIDDRHYRGDFNFVLTDPSKIGVQIGEVEFNTSKNVSNPEYRVRNGDSAFLEEGSKIYAIKGYPDYSYIAAESKDPIHHFKGYEVFRLEWKLDKSGKPIQLNVAQNVKFEEIPKDDLKKIEVYINNSNTLGGYDWKLINEVSKNENIKEFFSILNRSQPFDRENSGIQMELAKEYRIVFYTDEPFGYRFPVFYHKGLFFWRLGQEKLPNDINPYMKVEPTIERK